MALGIEGLDEQRYGSQPIGEGPLHVVVGRRARWQAAPRRQHRAFVAAHRLETRHGRLELPAFVDGGGAHQLGLDHLVAGGLGHELCQLVHLDRRVHVQLGEGRLLQHLAVRCQRLQGDDQAGFLLAPHLVAKAQRITRLQQHHIGIEAGHPLIAHQTRRVVRRNVGLTRAPQVVEHVQRVALLDLGNPALRQEGDDLVVAPEDRPGRPRQGLDSLHLLLPVADMPDTGTGHAAIGRRHHERAYIGAFARRIVHPCQPLVDVTFTRLRLRLGLFPRHGHRTRGCRRRLPGSRGNGGCQQADTRQRGT